MICETNCQGWVIGPDHSISRCEACGRFDSDSEATLALFADPLANERYWNSPLRDPAVYEAEKKEAFKEYARRALEWSRRSAKSKLRLKKAA